MNTIKRERREKIIAQRKDEILRLFFQQRFEKDSRLIVNFLVNNPKSIFPNGELNLEFFRDNYPNCTEEEVCVAQFIVRSPMAKHTKIEAQMALAKQANAERRLLPRQEEIDAHRNKIALFNIQQNRILNTLICCYEMIQRMAHYDPFYQRCMREWTIINERFKLTNPERVLTMDDYISPELVKVRQEISVSSKQLTEQVKAIETQYNIQLNAQRIVRARQSIALYQAVIDSQLSQQNHIRQTSTEPEDFEIRRLKTN
jgi:hypothetical protein